MMWQPLPLDTFLEKFGVWNVKRCKREGIKVYVIFIQIQGTVGFLGHSLHSYYNFIFILHYKNIFVLLFCHFIVRGFFHWQICQPAYKFFVLKYILNIFILKRLPSNFLHSKIVFTFISQGFFISWVDKNPYFCQPKKPLKIEWKKWKNYAVKNWRIFLENKASPSKMTFL